jgi:hypothetical protein
MEKDFSTSCQTENLWNVWKDINDTWYDCSLSLEGVLIITLECLEGQGHNLVQLYISHVQI